MPLPLTTALASMAVVLRRLLLPVAMAAVAWFLATATLSVAVEASFGYEAASAVGPFRDAHRLEEALVEDYRPAMDPLFVLASVLVGTFALFAPFAFAARGAGPGELRLACVGLVAALGLYIWAHSFVWSVGYPSQMASGFYTRLLVFALLGFAGLAVGVRRDPRHAS